MGANPDRKTGMIKGIVEAAPPPNLLNDGLILQDIL
jgi:hypothetical protein